MRKLIALLLAVALSLGAMPLAALAGDTDDTSDAALLALGGAMYGDMSEGFEDTFVIGILEHILNSLIGNIESRAWDKLWETIFGKDDSGKEIIHKLDEINKHLGEISNELIRLKKMLKEDSLERRVDARKDLMQEASDVLDGAYTQFDRATDLESKGNALDIFFRYNPKGFANAFYFFKNYCTMTAGTGTYQRVGYLDIYDRIADLKWNFDIEAAPFRQMQRDSDIHFITRMASALTLWLEKERLAGHMSKEAANLDLYEDMLRTGLEDVIRAMNEKAVVVDAKTRTFYLHDGERKQSFTFAISPYVFTNGYIFDYHLKTFIQVDNPVDEVVNRAKKTLDELTGELDIPGGTTHLINRAEMDVLIKAAQLRKVTVAQLLEQGAGIKKGFPTMAVLSTGPANQPIRVGPVERDNPSDAMSAVHRKYYVDYADLTKENAAGDAFYGSGRLDPWNARNLGFAGNPGAHSCLLRDADNSSRFDDQRFTLIFVTVTDIPAPATEGMGDGIAGLAMEATIDRLEGDTLTATNAEGSTGSLVLDAGTEVVDAAGNALADRQAIVGQRVRIDYRVAEPTPYTATRVTLLEGNAGRSAEGTVLRVESAAQIIGGDIDLVLDVDGAERIFALADGRMLPEGIEPGARVRVTYHEDASGMRVADSVELLMPPVPAPQVAEGTVAHVHHSGDMPGGMGLLMLDMPGGVARFLVPTQAEMSEDIQEGAFVRVTYHSADGGDTADAVELLDMPGPLPGPPPDDDGPMPGPIGDVPVPAPSPQWAEGRVTFISGTDDMPGGERTLVVMADREFTLVIPMAVDASGLYTGDTVHIDFHEEDGRLLVDGYMVLMPGPLPVDDSPLPGPIEDGEPSGDFGL